MDPQAYASTAARLAGAVPRDGSEQIARVLMEQLHLSPPARRRRLYLPSMIDLRRLGERRLRPPETLARLRQRAHAGRLRLRRVGRLTRWRRSHRV
jgi:hypothetical protein